ncbi:ROK family protein [uncultured Acetobacteroides sp.]|uniref:ROK family protein n=1 Tax=uncultured Acetobacteroides sp. TaxID=1760811 RepID=UPI0029F563BD|nr:ROK family protein [uncultured Acetobacteroides sp.]
MRRYAIGADIGGSHISCAVIDLNSKTIITETYASEEVNNKAEAKDIHDRWATAINRSLAHISADEVAGIGFAMPGPFSYDKGVALFTAQNDKLEKLYGINVGDELRTRLSINAASDIRFMNDATAFAVGEAWFGMGKDYCRSLSITLGTGFGSAFIADGIPVVDGNEVPDMGCVWHLPYKGSIADNNFSTRWCIRRYKELSGVEANGVKQIAEEAESSKVAKLVFEELGSNLGEFLAPWMIKFGAEALIIGGNISKAYRHFGQSLEKAFKNSGCQVAVHQSELMEDAALVGAARLFDEDFWSHVQPLLSKM